MSIPCYGNRIPGHHELNIVIDSMSRNSNESSLQTYPPPQRPQVKRHENPTLLGLFPPLDLGFSHHLFGMNKNWFSTTVLGWNAGVGNSEHFRFFGFPNWNLWGLPMKWKIPEFIRHEFCLHIEKRLWSQKNKLPFGNCDALPFCSSYISTYIWAIQKIKP